MMSQRVSNNINFTLAQGYQRSNSSSLLKETVCNQIKGPSDSLHVSREDASQEKGVLQTSTEKIESTATANIESDHVNLMFRNIKEKCSGENNVDEDDANGNQTENGERTHSGRPHGKFCPSVLSNDVPPRAKFQVPKMEVSVREETIGKRIRKPNRKYIEELPDANDGICCHKVTATTDNSIQEFNVAMPHGDFFRGISNRMSVLYRKDSSVVSGIQLPLLLRLQRRRTRRHRGSLMKSKGLEITDNLTQRTCLPQEMQHDSDNANTKQNVSCKSHEKYTESDREGNEEPVAIVKCNVDGRDRNILNASTQQDHPYLKLVFTDFGTANVNLVCANIADCLGENDKDGSIPSISQKTIQLQPLQSHAESAKGKQSIATISSRNEASVQSSIDAGEDTNVEALNSQGGSTVQCNLESVAQNKLNPSSLIQEDISHLEPDKKEGYIEQPVDLDLPDNIWDSECVKSESLEDTTDMYIKNKQTTRGGPRRKRHRSWTLHEVVKLIEGVAHFGVGRWAEIRKAAFSASGYRTSVDLKDKWRNLLRASYSQLETSKEDLKKRKQASSPIPTAILARVRELSTIQSQAISLPSPSIAVNDNRKLVHDTLKTNTSSEDLVNELSESNIFLGMTDVENDD